MSIKRLFEKVEMKQEAVIVSDTRKVDLSIIFFKFAILTTNVTCTVDNNTIEYVKKRTVQQ